MDKKKLTDQKKTEGKKRTELIRKLLRRDSPHRPTPRAADPADAGVSWARI
jgi:hypothetical protein